MKPYNRQNETTLPGPKERLIEAGTALFAAKGYACTTVREIVARAGVSKPVLYYYFKNKEGIFSAILEWAAQQQEELLSEVLRTPDSALDRLTGLFRRIYQAVMEQQDLFKLIHNLIFGPPQGAPEADLEQYHRRMIEALNEIFMQGPSNNKEKETYTEEASIIVLSILDFCLHMDYLHPESRDPELPERLLRLAFKGLD